MENKFKKEIIFSAYYFCNVGLFAFFLAVVPIFLVSRSFSLELVAYHSLGGTLAYMLGGSFALGLVGRKFSATSLVVISGIASPFLYAIFLIFENAWVMIFSWFLFFLVRIGANTVVDSELIAQTESGICRFEKIRLWGSIGFIIFGAIFGYCTDRFGVEVCAYIVLIVLILQVFLSLQAVKYFVVLKDTKRSFFSFEIFKNLPLVFLLVASALNWLSHAPLYTYLSIYLEKLHWSPQSITLAWNIGVISETIIFLSFSRIEKLISLRKLFCLSMLVMCGRWLILWSVQDYYVLLFSQALHAFSFGTVYLCSMRLVYQLSPDHLKPSSQGTLNLLGLGLGSLLGRILISYQAHWISSISEISELFLLSAICAFVAFLVSIKLLSKKPQI